jgi:SAM-dependent methyltransferase
MSTITNHQFTFPLNPKDFPSWHEYYWTYQYQLAMKFHLPLMEAWGVRFENAKVLDVGCGDGGFAAALADRGATCLGVELRDFTRRPHDNPRLRFVVQDVTAPDASQILGRDYDLIVLRDVIEHVPLAHKENFLASLRKLLKPSGKMFVTFPPFYSPYGLHQQTALKSGLRWIPYLHYLPRRLLRRLMSWMKEPAAGVLTVEEIAGSRMTIRHFKKLIQKIDMRIEQEKHYFVRPSHEIRYGWKTRVAWAGSVPLLRELLVSGATMLVAASDDENS